MRYKCLTGGMQNTIYNAIDFINVNNMKDHTCGCLETNFSVLVQFVCNG